MLLFVPIMKFMLKKFPRKVKCNVMKEERAV